MAFGLFGKKPPEKMQAKPAAKPRPVVDEASRAPAVVGRAPSQAPATPAKPEPPPAADFDDDLDLDFTGIQLAEETDPLQAVIEQAAIAFANGDDEEALAVLNDAVKAGDRSDTAERIWLMLFDLCQVTGNHAVFTSVELEYAQRFEKQPPVWKGSATAAAVSAAVGAATVFKGDLLAANAAGFDQALQALEKGPKLRLDLAKVKAVDPDGCQRLLDMLARGKKLKREVELLNIDALGALLEPKISEADRNQVYWQLMLDILQRQGRQEDFDNVALEFAITFEISPPSYEAPPKLPEKAAKASAKSPVARADDAFYLEGEILGGRIDGFDAWMQGRDKAVVDMAGVTRMDFTSAGTMLNAIIPHHQRGASILLRYPNRMIAELLRVVGFGEFVTFAFAKR